MEPIVVNATGESRKKAIQRLRDAARNVEQALSDLNIAELPCRECGSRHFENRTDATAFERLAQTPGRLRDVAAVLDADLKNLVGAEATRN